MQKYLPWNLPEANRPLLIQVNDGPAVRAVYVAGVFRLSANGARVEGEINWQYANNDHEDDGN